MDRDYSKRIEAAVISGAAIMRPGWVRLSFNYFIAPDEFEYILSAVELIAAHGWRLLTAYYYDTDTGVWRHRSRAAESMPLIADIDWMCPAPGNPQLFDAELAVELQNCRQMLSDYALDDRPEVMVFKPEHEDLRWFVTPAEVNCN
jgi:hypothetical protein